MAKAKRGPALFELLSEEGGATGGVKVPSWWSTHSPLTDLHAARAARAAKESPLEADEISLSPVERITLRPFFEVDGDCVRLSLTSLTAAVVVFLGLALVLSAYGLGAHRGDQGGFRRGFDAGRLDGANPAVDEIAALRNQPPAINLVGGLLQEAGVKPTGGAVREDRPAIKGTVTAPVKLPLTTAPAAGWVRGLTYVVAQEFPAANIEKARHAREFLAQRGVNTELVPLNNETTLLIATQGYNHKDPAQKRLADQLMEKVRTIGTQYYTAGGGYKLEGYYRTLKRDNW